MIQFDALFFSIGLVQPLASYDQTYICSWVGSAFLVALRYSHPLDTPTSGASLWFRACNGILDCYMGTDRLVAWQKKTFGAKMWLLQFVESFEEYSLI